MKKKISNIMLAIYIIIVTIIFIYLGVKNIDNLYWYYLIYSVVYKMIMAILGLIIYQRRFSKIKKFDYFRNYDFKIEPLAAGYVINKSRLGINSMIIMIYNLIEKNILKQRYDGDKIFIKLSNNHLKSEINKLEYYESMLVKSIFAGEEDTNEYELHEIMHNFVSQPEQTLMYNRILKDLKIQINIKGYKVTIIDILTNLKNIFYKNLVKNYNIIIALDLVTWIGPIMTLSNGTSHPILLIILFIFSIILNIYIMYYNKYINKNYMEEYSQLKGLYNFLNDYANIKNNPLKYIEIYDKYYLYALSFNLTEEVEKEFQIHSDINNYININHKYLFYKEKEVNDGTNK